LNSKSADLPLKTSPFPIPLPVEHQLALIPTRHIEELDNVIRCTWELKLFFSHNIRKYHKLLELKRLKLVFYNWLGLRNLALKLFQSESKFFKFKLSFIFPIGNKIRHNILDFNYIQRLKSILEVTQTIRRIE
jgi:hypothetical protein